MVDLGFALNAYCIAITFLLGLVMGSFMNCVALRITNGESFMKGRSHCAHCEHTLTFRELIPVFSYVFQKGKSRCCGKKISRRYPISELIMGTVFVVFFVRFGFSLQTLMFWVFSLILFGLSLVDLDSGLIPDRFILAGIFNFLVFTILQGGSFFYNIGIGLASGFSVAVPILVLSLIMDKVLGKDTMGGGDIKLFFMAGLYLDFASNIFLVVLSCVMGIVFTLVFSNIRINDDEEDPMAFPFGPSIAAAAVVSVLFAEPFVNWYLGLF